MHAYPAFWTNNIGAAESVVGSWMKAFLRRRSRLIDEARKFHLYAMRCIGLVPTRHEIEPNLHYS
jgi:hypothetical protein